MLQVVQHQKSGEIMLGEMPKPQCPKGGILVENFYSLISAGTERSSVESTKSSLLQRARKQPDQVKTVLDTLKKEGIAPTVRKVLTKLDSYKTLGYSTAGKVIESSCDEFSPGDLVACAGAGIAVHAEIIAVPKNLACLIPEGVDPADAAYTTLGTIAMQGVRQADVRLGETVAVIGLGLIGMITVQLLKASGCRVIGLDIDNNLMGPAEKLGCSRTYPSSFESVAGIMAFSRGYGCDSVIITAATPSNEPMKLAMEIARRKGKIIIVGAVGMDLPRSPFYEKELDIRISTSYGPGRYDKNYEIHGHDYPIAYARWTENRNMSSFLDLLQDKKMDVKSLTSHIFDLDNANDAYELITGEKEEPYLGILLKYPLGNNKLSETIENKNYKATGSGPKVSFIGAGSFAQSYLLPALKNAGAVNQTVTTETAVNAKTAADHFGFKFSSTDSMAVLADKDSDAVFIATRHDTHGRFVAEALKNGKAVFVEKPLGVTRGEIEEIDKYEASGRVMVGFNRRFSLVFVKMKEFFSARKQPFAMSYRVNAGRLKKGHWVFTPENGGRIIGEACHFIDCMVYLTGELPVSVMAYPLSTDDAEAVNRDTAVISIKFSGGSIGSVLYAANGDKAVPKEYFEAYCEGSTAIMTDFRELKLYRGKNEKKLNFNGKKGHEEEVELTIDAIKNGKPMPITYAELKAVSIAAIAAVESMESGLPVNTGF